MFAVQLAHDSIIHIGNRNPLGAGSEFVPKFLEEITDGSIPRATKLASR